MLQDILGRPIQKGDTVLVKGYGSPCNDTIAIVDKVAKVNVYVYVPDRWASYYNKRYPKNEQRPESKRMARRPSECIIINEQIAYNNDTWPELQI